MSGLDPAWIALIGTLGGTVGLKVVEHWLTKSRTRVDEAGKIRDELRVEIVALREENKALEEELDKVKRDYYALLKSNAELNAQYLIALDRLKREAEEAIKRMPPDIQPPPPA